MKDFKTFVEEIRQDLNEVELNELSKKTLGNYIKRASHGEVEGKPYKGNSLYSYGEKRKEQEIERSRFNDAENTVRNAGLGEVKGLDDKMQEVRKRLNREETKRANKEFHRYKGINRAVAKLTKEDFVLSAQELTNLEESFDNKTDHGAEKL